MGLAMETICTFFLNYEQYIILLTICFFAGMAWRHHRLISRLFIIAASCLWVIYVYRYQIAVGWPALDASGELSLRELFSDGAFIQHWFYLLSAAALGGALGVAFDDTRPNQARARYGLESPQLWLAAGGSHGQLAEDQTNWPLTESLPAAMGDSVTGPIPDRRAPSRKS